MGIEKKRDDVGGNGIAQKGVIGRGQGGEGGEISQLGRVW